MQVDTYRSNASMQTVMSSNAIGPTPTAGLHRLVNPLVDPQTYRNIVFLLLRLPLGIAYFTTFFTGLALGIVLTPLGVGIPLLGIIIGSSDYAGMLEAKITSLLLDRELIHVPIHEPHEQPPVEYLKATLTEPRSYLLVAYFLVSLAVGIATFTFVVLVFTLSIVLLMAPLASTLFATRYTVPAFEQAGSTVVVDTLPQELALSVAGLLLLIVGMHAANVLAAGHGRGTAALLRDS